MTIHEAEQSGMSDLDIALAIVTGEIEEPEPEEFIHPVHEKIVGTRFDAYHDVTVYEDGHESKVYIGD